MSYIKYINLIMTMKKSLENIESKEIVNLDNENYIYNNWAYFIYNSIKKEEIDTLIKDSINANINLLYRITKILET